MKITPLFSMLAIIPAISPAQTLSFGVQGGAPVQTSLTSGGSSSIPFAVGPTIGLRLSSSLSLETGLLYNRLGKSTDNGVFLFPTESVTLLNERWRGNAIEVPLLLKYYFLNPGRTWRPFLAGGPALRRTSLELSRQTSILSPNPLILATDNQSNSVHWNLDPEAAAGVSFRAGRAHIEPQVRYSYWGAGKNSVIRKNQVSFLFGLRF